MNGSVLQSFLCEKKKKTKTKKKRSVMKKNKNICKEEEKEDLWCAGLVSHFFFHEAGPNRVSAVSELCPGHIQLFKTRIQLCPRSIPCRIWHGYSTQFAVSVLPRILQKQSMTGNWSQRRGYVVLKVIYSGGFKIRSYDRALAPTEVEKFPWKCIWKPKVPTKAAFLSLGCFFGKNPSNR